MKGFHRSALFNTSVIALSALMMVSCAKKGSSSSSYKQQAQEPFPHLGKSANFALLANNNISVTGMKNIIYGDVGVVTPTGKITGLNTVKRTGGEDHFGDAYVQKAQADATNAYNNLKAKTCDHDLSGKNLGGMTLTPGTYCFTGPATLDGLLTLDAKNDPDASFIFQVGSDLFTSAQSAVTILNKGETCNVFWQLNGSASLSPGTNFTGQILATNDVSLDAVMMNGKVLAKNGSIQMNSTQIFNNTCPWPGEK